MKYDPDSRNARLGADAELDAAKIMQDHKCAVLPVCSFQGNTEVTKAPMFLPPEGGVIVCPDLLTFRNGKQTWVDVKGKSVPSWRIYPPGPRWEHGIDYAHVLEYKRCGELTGSDVWILLRESARPEDPDNESPLVAEDTWLAIKLSEVVKYGDRRGDWPGGARYRTDRGARGMGGWLWPRSRMVRWCVPDGGSA